MAVNVLLVFFKGANPHTIKKWGWLYCLICYGGPFVIAIVCLFLREPNKTVVYGSAGVSQPWPVYWTWLSANEKIPSFGAGLATIGTRCGSTLTTC